MGQIQSAVNNLTTNVMGATFGKKIATGLNAMAASEKSAKAADFSYGNDLNKIMGEAMATNPKLKESKYYEKALSLMQSKKDLMMNQRANWRAYRDSFAKGSEEWNEAERVGQERRSANLEDFKTSLAKLGKPGRPKGGR